jgi:PAS domain S-box-containing protein
VVPDDADGTGMGPQGGRSVAERLAAAFDASSVAMGLVAADGTWLRFNDRLCELLRTDRETLQARRPGDLIHPDDRPAAVEATRRLLTGEVGAVDAERRYLRADGRVLRARVTTSVVRLPDGSTDSLLTQLVVASGARAAQDGSRDPVTGALTRDALVRDVDLAQRRSRRSGRLLVLVSADVDGLDPASAHGGRVLACLAQRMTSAVRGTDVVGRSGPARLTVVCEGMLDDAEIDLVLARLARSLADPVEVDGLVSTPASRLAAVVESEGESARELVSRPGWPAPAPAPPAGPGGRGGRRARHGLDSAL